MQPEAIVLLMAMLFVSFGLLATAITAAHVSDRFGEALLAFGAAGESLFDYLLFKATGSHNELYVAGIGICAVGSIFLIAHSAVVNADLRSAFRRGLHRCKLFLWQWNFGNEGLRGEQGHSLPRSSATVQQLPPLHVDLKFYFDVPSRDRSNVGNLSQKQPITGQTSS